VIVRMLLSVLIGSAIGAVMGYFGKCASGTCPLTANPYRGAIYGAVMGVVFALAFSRAPRAASRKTYAGEPGRPSSSRVAGGPVLHIESQSDFKARVLDAKGICVVDFFSDHCPPCRALAPTVASLADRYAGRVAVCKVDVDLLPKVADQYRVRAIPTVLIIKDGKEVKRLLGLSPEAEYVALLDELLGEVKQ